MSNLDKNSIINMENTASYQPRSNLNVVFSTADRDSAVFIFNVTKGNKPLLLSSENVIGHIALKHSDGSFVKDTLHFTEPDINGRFEYYIPNDILKREGTVTMQIFISEKGNSNVTVAERIVTFDIEKSIVSQISAETKLQYIVEYDELKAIIANRVTDIEDNMANAEDYVSQLKQAREKGLSDIEIAKADSEKALNDLADKRLEEISDKAREYSSKFDDDKQYMDEKFEAFKTSVNGSGLVTTGQSKDWQKVKLTSDSGIRTYLTKGSVKDIKALSSGFYETVVAGTTDATEFPKVSYGSFVEIDVMKADGGRTQLKLVISGTGRTFNRYIHTNASNDTGLLEVPQFADITTMETTSGSQAKATTAENNAKQYTDNKVLNDKTLIYNGSANGVGTDLNLSETLDNFVFLFIYGSASGVYFTATGNPMDNNNITVSCTNVIDSEGNGGGHYEALLSKTSRTKLKITNDVYFDFGSGIGSGANANKITINKIIGVRKYANIN